MDCSNLTLGRVGPIVAYSVLGLIGTAGVVLFVLNVSQPVQAVLYRAVYLRVGPSEATETAILAQFLGVGLVGISIPMVIADYLSDGLTHRRALGIGIGVMAGLLIGFFAVALAGLAAFLTSLSILVIAVISVPVLLRYRLGVRSGALPAFVGGIPVLFLLVLAVGFGLGWGWGYVITAQEVPAETVNGSVATFDDARAFEAELFADCEIDTAGRQVCRLFL
jgi:MFS family permease